MIFSPIEKRVNPSFGTELKINIHIEPVDGKSMDDYNFNVSFYTKSSKSLEVDKSQMVRVDKDNYTALVDTAEVGVGDLKALVTAYIPDSDFEDGFRTEKTRIRVNIFIDK